MGRAVVPRERSWLQPQADEQERLDGQAREGSSMFTWTHWPNILAHVGGLQLLFKQAGPHPGVHLSVYLYILSE